MRLSGDLGPDWPWRGRAIQEISLNESSLELRLESREDHWVVYTEPEHALCVEPMTRPPDALNSGAQIVEPDHPLIATMKLSWRVDSDP